MTFQQPFADYEILARVGSGAMGTVFKARQKKLNRIVALKVLKPSLARDARYVDRLRREARIVAALNHPNIVAGHDLGEEAGYHFFVMEFVEGRSLKDLLAEWGTFPEEQVLDVAIQITSALDHAFRKGVIHRDVKPGNVLIDAHGHVKLTDMGLAKGPTDLTITRDGATVGTPQYISPEQARDPQSADIRSDLYSLGCTLFHMATGQPPFVGSTLAEVLTKVLQDRAPTAHGINPGIGDGLSLVIRKLLAKDPDLRYQDPEALMEDLERVRRSEQPDVDVSQLDSGERRSPWYRSPVMVAGVAGGFAVLALVAVVALWMRGDGGDGPVWTSESLKREIGERLAAAPDFAAKHAVLDAASRALADERLRPILESMRVAVESSLRTELVRSLTETCAAEATALRNWLSGAGVGRVPDEYLREVFDPLVRRTHRIGIAELPAGTRDALSAQFRRLVDDALERRDAAYRADLDEYAARRIDRAVEDQIEGGDFVAAERVLRDAIAAWYAQEGRPAAVDLPAALRAATDDLLTKRESTWMQRIAEAEQRRSSALREEVQRSVAMLDGAEAERDPRRTMREFERLREELLELYPATRFRSSSDPWPKVEAELRIYERKVRGAVEALDELALDDLIRLVLQGLLDGGEIRDAIVWVDLLDLVGERAVERRRRFRQWLDDASQAERQLAERVHAAGGSVRTTRAVDGVDEPATLVAAPASGGSPFRFETRTGFADARPAAIRWSDVVRATGTGGGLPDSARRGIAFLLALSGDLGRAVAEYAAVDEADARRFTADVVDRIKLLRPRAKSEADALLDELLAAFRTKDVVRVQLALDRMSDTAIAERFADDRRVREVAQWVQRERTRRSLDGRLRQSFPGATVEVDEALGFVVDLRGAALPVGEGFVRSPNGLRIAVDGAPAWVFRIADEKRAFVSIELDVAFPDPSTGPRVVLLDAAGIGVVFGLLHDGSVVAKVVPAEILGRPEALRRAMQKSIESTWLEPRAWVLPGIRQTLRVDVEPSRGRQHVVVKFARVVLADETVSIDAPAGPLAVRVQGTSSVEIARLGIAARN